jgi:choline dehydrogenase-like flavoprotein
VICSGDSLPDHGDSEVEVAIVGAGPVGLAVATRLAGRIGRIALIEAGGTRFNPLESLSFFEAVQIDDSRHSPTELNRRRMLGGTSSIWGGRCIPLDPEDFAPACDRPGWPIAFAEMDEHIAAALEFLDAGKPEFSAVAALPTHTVSLGASAADLDVGRIERYSKPTQVWKKWKATLARSRHVTVIHGATCTNVITSPDGTSVIAVELRTASSRCYKIVASVIVLACGGLETPRLLLASRGKRSCGLGNEHDLVGRFYMTHLVSNARNVGALRFTTAETARAFDYNITSDGVYGRRMILLSPLARERNGIGNIVFRPTRPPIDDAQHRDPVLSAMSLSRNLIIPPEYARSLTAEASASPLLKWRAHAANIVTGFPSLCRFGIDWLTKRVFATRKLPSVFLYRADGTYPLEFNAEHMPNAESRVLLGCETDPFGVPRLVVQWRMSDSELGWICRAYRLLAGAAAQSGLGAIRLDPDLPGSVQRALVPQGGHHIGTARMGVDARTGVVDPNGEVWGTRGLFVAGTAIFPTSGFANPTLTAVALAFRLADYLIRRRNAATTPAPINFFCPIASRNSIVSQRM